MFRLLIMCLLGLSGVFFVTSGIQASPVDTPLMDMMSTTNEAEGMTTKSKRHHDHPGLPCSQSYSHSGSYLPPASVSYQKPLIIPSYHQMPKAELIGYQKPAVPKMIYQTIHRPAINHAAYNVQPMVKQQVQYIQQPTYVPTVKEHPISYIKSGVAPTVSYENIPKFITGYVKPVQHIQSVQTIHPPAVKTYVKQIPCEIHGPAVAPAVVEKPMEKPMVQMVQSYYGKQYYQPISYYPKPLIQPKPISTPSVHLNKYDYPSTNVVYQKPHLISQPQPTIKVSSVAQPGCEKIHQPQITYVKIPQPVLHNVHQPMIQYAPKFHHHEPMVHFAQKVQQPMFHFAPQIHQPAVVQQPLVHFAPKVHQPIEHNAVVQYAPPIVYGNAGHSVSTVAPHVSYERHYQSPIVSAVHQPCHK